jgi:hypothetical protein
VVVLDTRSRLAYIGTLAGWSGDFFVVDDADVHDLATSSMTREVYLIQSKTHGVHVSRRRVYVRASQVVSVSALDDVVTY